MRMIDADALKDRLQSLSYDDWNQGVSTTWANAYAECSDMVEDMPTVEPERKNGKWIWKTGDVYKCSECETETHVDECFEEPIYNYCPYCNAVMDGYER